MTRAIAILLASCVAPGDFDRFESEAGGVEDAGRSSDAGRDAGCESEDPCDGVDDDCNGIVDDGCAFFFGRPSPMLIGPGAQVRSPRLSRDGRRLYVVIDGRVLVASRGGVDDRFGPPAELGLPGELDVYDVALSADEREIFLGARMIGMTDHDVLTATRASAFSDFGDLTPVPGASGPSQQQRGPFLSRDGTELFFVSDGGMGRWRIVRVTRAGGFADPMEIVLGIPGAHDLAPFLADDGARLFFSRAEDSGATDRRVMMATRAPGAISFDSLEEIAALEVPGTITEIGVISETTGEVFFTSDRAWSSPAMGGLWRAHVCRDGPCIDATIACGGMRSPDLRTCYVLGSAAASWDAARTACSPSRLATVHSLAERDLVQTIAGAATHVWLGASDTVTEGTFVWASGEPFTFSAWAPGQPNNEGEQDCMTHSTAAIAWDDCQCVDCASMPRALCESELWPW